MCVITGPELQQSMKNFETYMWVCLTKSRTSTSLLLSSRAHQIRQSSIKVRRVETLFLSPI
jgi:hypothetical protein